MGFITEMATGVPGRHRAGSRTPTAPLAETLRLNGYSDRRLRQVARDGRLGDQRRRPVRPLADAPGLRQVLRLPRRRDEPVGAVPVRRRRAGRAAERPELPLHDRHDGEGAGLDQVPEGADARTSRSFVYFAPGRDARAAPRAAGVDRQVEGQVRPGLGQDARGDARAADRGRRRARRARSSRRSRRRSRTGTSSRPTRSACSRARPRSSPAFVEYTDHEIGRMLKAFDEVGQADNTLVFYIVGDNGTSGEGGAERHVQRVHLLQRRAREGRGHAEAHRQVGRARDLPAHGRRLVGGAQRARSAG